MCDIIDFNPYILVYFMFLDNIRRNQPFCMTVSFLLLGGGGNMQRKRERLGNEYFRNEH